MTGGNRQTVQTTADTFAFKYALSAIAAVVAETATYPFDITKTRLQLQREGLIVGSQCNHGTCVPYRGMVATALGIVQEEGLTSIYQGLSAALYRHIIYTGLRMTFYEVIRESILKKEADGSYPVWKASLGGLTAGALGQFIASPADLVKVQMQMEGRRRLEGKPSRVKNVSHALKQIIAEGGYKGLYRGCVPNVQRAALVNMGDLCTYDTAKQKLLKWTTLEDNYVTHTIASAMSGLVAATLGTPADNVKTRIMNQPTENGRGLMYKGTLDCLVTTVQQEGFWTLYRGFVPIWLRMAPWSLTFWLTYEQVRRMSGAGSF
ncbi:mitochondrial uncoupling protein 4-like [Mizuhopecten yessoensis]|uniref:Mitochondrial uncoupling protein 4 n=1 Tax=Mizuhopecten yessoensis TaxID=6573 RepID=A0A210QKY8_MIZYE|nr:mitochondrial uncoupling protein 4-like [Mizuhopecten yessoensis]OWF49407.1 Mitochondrial uncoupling protein 4 [Mizuhopecten yessoensis]